MTKRQSDSRERIIDAAYLVLMEQGYGAASIKEIARAAGVAPGLVHYYFASKDDLLVAVLRATSDRYTAEMERRSQEVPPAALASAGLQEPEERATRQPEWYRLRYELFALAMRNPALEEGVAALLANGRQGIGNIVRKAAGNQALDPNALAGVLLACFDGLALQKLADPHFDIHAAYQMLSRMVGLLLESWAE